MPAWWQALQRRREARAVVRRAIPDDLWQAGVAALPFIATRPPLQVERLRRLASLFLDRKEFSGAQGFVVTDAIALSVALQACMPILERGIDEYDGFVGIVMHRGAVLAPREVMDEHGIVHAYDEELAGEAMDGGPLMLSWDDAQPTAAPSDEGAAGAYNVVIHEFAHVLDLRDGQADGVPLLDNAAARRAWLDVLMPEYDRFCERVVCGYDTVLDPYGAEAVDEFFAVASEAFFIAARALKQEQAALYGLLQSYYRQDPALY
jgi:Mlc titration factor MtfA (ptsG expression regulator)